LVRQCELFLEVQPYIAKPVGTVSGVEDHDGQFNFEHIRIDDNDSGAEDPITPEPRTV
jgi:hypothetical protein